MADIIDLQSQLLTGPLADVRLYAVPNATMLVFQDLINATWNLALTQSTAVGAKTAALTAASGMLDPSLSPTVTGGSITPPTITAPSVTIPSSITVPSIFADFKTEYLDLATWMTNQYTSWISSYAPNNQALYSAGENSLLSAIQSGSFIPSAVQSQIMGDDTARIIADMNRAADASVAFFAGRRMPLPADVAASSILQIQQRAQNQQAESSRKIAIMSIEQYRFVVQQIMEQRDMVLKHAIEYAKTETMAPEMISKMLGIGYDIQVKLITAASAFYNADAQAKEIITKANEFNASMSLDVSKANQSAKLAIIDANLKALLGEIASITQQATALFNNLHIQATMNAGGTTVSTQAI